MQTHKPWARSRDGEHPFCTMKASHGGDTLPHQKASKSSRRDSSPVLAYNLTRGHEIVGIKPLMAAIVA